MQPAHNPHAKWRIGLARQLAERLSTFDGVQAMVIAGSVARGYADEYSDLEIPVFWDRTPDDATRQALVATLPASFLYTYDGPSREDQLLIQGLQVDLWHNTVSDENAVIEAVLRDYSTDLGDSNFMDTVCACIPLYGDGIIQEWKRRAQEYPDELARRVIGEHLPAFSTSELTLHVHRHNPSAFYACLCHLQQKVFLVLLALNRAYFPTFKWMYHSLDAMQVKPPDVAQRFRQAFSVPCAEAMADTVQVLQETLELVEQHAPQMDTALVRRRLAYTRAAHKKPIRL
jgi:predicted nucleotidyltransferase